MAVSRPAPPLRVFVSYSHHDEALCGRFLVHLSELRRQGLIEPWHDRRIAPGAEWAGVIDDQLNAAHIVILLVTADFLASDYCNDVEMTRALERSQNGEARVVPVILSPCDWETSRFAGFQALPKDGKPVIDWATPDHGFNNVVKGLRGLIVELCGTTPVGVQVLRTSVRHHPWYWSAAALLALLLIPLSTGNRYLAQGTDLLNVGRYSEARPALERAKFLNPFSPTARCAAKTVELDSNQADDRHVDEAARASPNCAYLKVLNGDRKYLQGDLAGALADYRDAVQHEPNLAEAHFDIGLILERQDKPDDALPEYQLASKLSSDTPRYRLNLADLYVRSEEYDKAIKEYGQMGESPLAALELARIYRLQNRLEEAQGRDEDAIRWLKDPSIQNAERENAWALDVGALQRVRLGPIAEKQCYADLELEVTRFLQGNEAQAATTVPATLKACSSRQHELKNILNWELHRLGSENHKLAEQSDKFAQRFLAGVGNKLP